VSREQKKERNTITQGFSEKSGEIKTALQVINSLQVWGRLSSKPTDGSHQPISQLNYLRTI
jgi:hypothetical protein